jgi:antitoxin component of RelBE/YafQ-DinJ toxin-antitoxin module
MHSKLTLRLDEEVIEHAKAYSKHAGKSVSQVVNDYFLQLEGPVQYEHLPPITESLRGILKRAMHAHTI